MKNKQQAAIILLFLGLIYGMTFCSLLKPTKDFSEKENRVLAQSPDLSAETYFSGKFAQDYESFITDQFIWRDQWIGMKTALEKASFKQESNGVYFAKDGYLIEKHEGVFRSDTAQNNISYLSAFMKEAVKEYGTNRVTAMVIPNAVNILEDKLPPFAPTGDEQEYLKKVADAMPKGSWFDSEKVLKEHSSEDLYYKTDHHWKTKAAYYVYYEWAKEQGFVPLGRKDYQVEIVSEDFQGTIEAKVGGESAKDSIEIFKPLKEEEYTLLYNEKEQKKDLYHWEALDTKDKYGIFFGGNQPVVECTIQNQSNRKLLVIKDSYAHCFLPFTFHEYSQVDFVDLRYFIQSLREYRQKKQYTDILFLYNASGFAEDPNLAKLGN